MTPAGGIAGRRGAYRVTEGTYASDSLERDNPKRPATFGSCAKRLRRRKRETRKGLGGAEPDSSQNKMLALDSEHGFPAPHDAERKSEALALHPIQVASVSPLIAVLIA